MDAIPFFAGILVGIALCLLLCRINRRQPTPPVPDDGMIVLEFILGEPREQPTPTRSSR